MNTRFFKALLVLTALHATTQVAARALVNGSAPAPHLSYKTEAGSCNIPVSQVDLDINNVRARLLNAGDMWWDLNAAGYEVPKGDKTLGINYPKAIFAGAIWVTAKDAGGNLKSAAQTYRQGNTDFFTGPLDANANVSLATCNAWDRFFNVYKTDVQAVQAQFAATSSVGTMPDNVRFWPAKGNPNLANTLDVSGTLASFYDRDGDGLYDPSKGDYPNIPSRVGQNQQVADQMIFWVMNDKGNIHSASQGAPLGIQVNATAFGFQTADEVNNMTFYNYKIINKSGFDLNSTYFTQFVDPDLGCANNDRIGCDTSRSLGIVYNGQLGSNACDNGAACPTGAVGYGCNLPILGIDYFEGPVDTGVTNVSCKTNFMSSFAYFSIGTDAKSDPTSAAQFRNYQTGKWKDGTPFTYSGTGYGGSIPTNYAFPGNPANATQWSECNTQGPNPIAAGDRRFLETTGPFYFRNNAIQNVTVGVVFVYPEGGIGSTCPDFNTTIGPADDKAQALFCSGFAVLTGPDAPTLSIREMDKKFILKLVNDGFSNNIGENFVKVDQQIFTKGFFIPNVSDSAYRFQGYIVYQLAGPQVTATDLNDKTKAAIIMTMDIQDNIKHGVNWGASSDATVKFKVPTESLTLPNAGIQHSIIVNQDYINGGPLVNHQTYYYGVVAFATNQYHSYDPSTNKGQDIEFIKSKVFTRYSAIPADPTVENYGRQLNSSYGSATEVQRIEGQGNGANYLNLTPATVAKIIDPNNPTFSADTLNYVKGFDPLGFKVVDPISMKEGEFELTIFDTVPYNGYAVSNGAWWQLINTTTKDTIHSDRVLDRPYEQLIQSVNGTDYGFSLTLGTPAQVYTILNANPAKNRPVYGVGSLKSSITFEDVNKQWLSFVKDSGQDAATNWVRSGSTKLPCSGGTPDALCNVFVDAYYNVSGKPNFSDQDKLFDQIIDGKWAPYCLAANWNQGVTVMTDAQTKGGRPYSVGGPAFKWDVLTDQSTPPENTLDKLQSVDIIITPDKTKWSHCVVFETGEGSTQGGDFSPSTHPYPPIKGALRGHAGLKQDGSPDDVGNEGMSWFPGYAVNIETGQRLNIAFGESSDRADNNGADMIWNPTSTLYEGLAGSSKIPNNPIWGGKHHIYVFSTNYDEGYDVQATERSVTNYDALNLPGATSVPSGIAAMYRNIMWTCIPYLTPGFQFKSMADGLVPGEVTIRLRAQKPFAKYGTGATGGVGSVGDSLPRYHFSTVGLGAKDSVDTIAKTALDLIRIVPNPYYATSRYETGSNDTRVKITNLPNTCTIRIYSLDGTLIRVLDRSIGRDPATNRKVELSDGSNIDDPNYSGNLDNSTDWDLKNDKNIPIGSGIYIFDINAPGKGHKTLKWFGAMRPTDISNF